MNATRHPFGLSLSKQEPRRMQPFDQFRANGGASALSSLSKSLHY